MANARKHSGMAGIGNGRAVPAARRLLGGVSAGALLLGLSASPAAAQLAAMRAAAGTLQVPSASTLATAPSVRPVTMQEALQRAQALQSRADALATYVTSAQAAARASLVPIRTNVIDGISAPTIDPVTGKVIATGLNPIAPVRAATLFVANGTSAAGVTANAVPASVAAVNDSSGLATWEGALAPVQSTDAGGNVTVRIDQTQARALLSWTTFDVGAKTSLVFNQSQAGAPQASWTVVNRVITPVNPSAILGSIKADGTVLVLNSAGVMFGPNSQVKLNSLIASSLDIGNFASNVVSVGPQSYFVASTIKDRNTSFLQNGLLVSGQPGYKAQLLSGVLPAGQYAVNQPLPTPAALEGDVTVYQGARLTSGDGGFLILAGPTVTNAGILTANNGQVSLQGGRYIGATPSTGSDNGVDPYVRGLILSSQVAATPTAAQAFTADQGTVTNYGLIDSPRGYLSLGASVFGQVTNVGLLRSSTSVSRNGKISLLAGSVTLTGSTDPTQASGLVILPDTNGETIPLGTADSPPAFKTSQITIGDSVTGYLSSDTTGDIALFPSTFTMGQNAFIYAPSAKVVIGHDAALGSFGQVTAVASSVTIANAAIIDVSGVKDVQIAASRNSVGITPVKRNELRDTPNYREVTTDGSFTLNGTTLYVDPRASGVRADGVAWTGSPLIEAASAISQTPITAAELMTKGGAISIDLGPLTGANNLVASGVPAINIARGAIFDVSGGWVHYNSGTIVTSQLITADGRIVDISKADPNDNFVDVVNGFTSAQPKFGLSSTYANAVLQGSHFEVGYDEGRDAGALMVTGSNISFDGTLFGNAFAGANQIASSLAPTKGSAIAADPRKLQRSALQLPSGGLFRIGSFTGSSAVGLGGDIVVYNGIRGAAPSDPAEILLDSQMLNAAGLSALLLQTSGAVKFAGAADTTLQTAAALTLTGTSNLKLAAGGTLEVDAGRSIMFNGNVSIAGGTIAARTYQLSNVTAAGIGTVGSPYRTDDDISLGYAVGASLPHPFDMTVNGTLSTAGRWTNDYLGAAAPLGSAWIDGGSISLTVAPKVLTPLGATQQTATQVGDLSGSLYINAGALLDVSSGGYVSPTRNFDLSGTGGNVSLINQTTYATVIPTIVDAADPGGTTVSGQTVAFTPVVSTATTAGVLPTAVPLNPVSVVQFAPGSIRGFGFAGGGTFTLVSPSIALNGGGNADPNATQIPLDFLSKTGFGTLDITAYHSRIVRNLFDNSSPSASAFFDTTRLVIGSGQTLDLTQVTLPTILDANTQLLLAGLTTGSNVATTLTPLVQAPLWERKAANLALHGLMELEVAQGGKIVGAPLASIVAPKLYNAGSIVLPGGTISQVATLPSVLNGTGYGLTDVAFGGTGFTAVFGAANANGQYLANGLNTAGFVDLSGAIETNNQIFTTPDVDSDPTTNPEHFLYFLGRLGAGDGIVLANGSRTDLSGVALYNPAAPYRADGTQYRFGKVIAGGSIGTASIYNPTGDLTQALFANPQYGFASYPDPASISPTPPPLLTQTVARGVFARSGSTIDISGASGTYDELVSATSYAPSLQWSDAGTLALRAGGSLSGSTVNAHGGATGAAGGTLIWLKPTIQAVDSGAGAVDVAFADHIGKAGFSSLVAYGGLTLDGQFQLNLGKSLLVESAPAVDETRLGGNADVIISATANTGATISAPYIRFASRSGSVATSTAVVGNGTVTFAAGASGLDLAGGILFDPTIGSTFLTSATDIRLIGVDDRNDLSLLPVLNGSLVSTGDLTFNAQRVYATTGTGNLQRILELEANPPNVPVTPPSPYLLTALGNSQITFLAGNLNLDTPLSAGSYLRISAARVVQNGYLAAPLGRIEFGTAANPVSTVLFGASSVTSVSSFGKNIPYGTTTDLTEYYFNPGTTAPITQLPSGDLRITSNAINVAAGATVDGRGGGDVFAYEFVSGTGGSRDVLSRFNSDVFSSNGYDTATGLGYQFKDQRQVYAIVPVATAAKMALVDPIYSADYGASGAVDLYGAQAGLSVTLDGGGGIPAGQYVLLPAHYALLTGAYRVVENAGTNAPAPGLAQTLLDGSVVMGGQYSTAGTGLVESQRRSFTIQSQATALKFSNIQTTSGTATIQALATSKGIVTPRLPLDAARVILSPLNSLQVAGLFQTTPGAGGRGSEIDILGNRILINHSGARSGPGLILTDTTIANLNANSLLIGGQRSENNDDTTLLSVAASHITVENGTMLTVPELLLAVGGINSTLTIDPGASLIATGTLADSRAGDYFVLSSSTPPGNTPFDYSGVGSILRLSNGPQRLVDRQGSLATRNTLRTTTLDIGAATLSGQSLMLDTSRTYSIASGASLIAPNIALSADQIQFSSVSGIDPVIEAKLASAANLVLRSADTIAFDPGSSHTFNNLTLDAPGISLTAQTGGLDTLTINARDVRLQNSSTINPPCFGAGQFACGASGNALTINAATLTFGSGTFRTFPFDGSVSLTALNGAYYEGLGSLNTGAAALTITTPFLVDRAKVVDPTLASTTPSDTITPSGNYTIPATPNFSLASTGSVTMTAPTLAPGASAPTAAGIRAPGAHVTFGSAASPIASLAITGTAIGATAGVIDVRSAGSITLAGAASLSTPGYSRSFGNAQSSTTISAGGGTVNLVSLNGDIVLPATSAINVDSGIGNAGRLNLLAAQGGVTLGATLNQSATGSRLASLMLDSQTVSFDLDTFAVRYGTLFGGDLSIRSGTGSLTLAAGHALRATSVSLTADGGLLTIAGTIDTSGVNVSGLSANAAATARVNGGNIALWGMSGVTLASGSLLDTHTTGYLNSDTRQANAGNVSIGIGNAGGAIDIVQGATIDLGARRTQAALAAGLTGNRMVSKTVKDPNTLVDTTVYEFVAADNGGTLGLRAPLVGSNMVKVDIRLGGTVTGAGSQQVEAYRTYDLKAIAKTGYFDGLANVGTGIELNAIETGFNLLSDDLVAPDGTPSIVNFIRNFSVSALNGSSLAGMRLRPGVDLVSFGDLNLVTNWNLGAGVVNQTAAAAAGVLALIPELGLRKDGTPYYAVVAGQEGALLENYTSFLYRVGGQASGEAGVFNFRAPGNLNVSNPSSTASITDGFFTFGDKSDPYYINYQTGGGNRVIDPAVRFSCGTNLDCSTVTTYAAVSSGSVVADPTNTLTIALNRLLQGNPMTAQYINSPYNADNNSAGALGTNFDPGNGNLSGDPLGFAQLFPLLANGSTIRSSSLRLTAGAGSVLSANPLHIDTGTQGNLVVSGQASYALSVLGGTLTLGNSLDLQLNTGNATGPVFSLASLIGNSDPSNSVNQLQADSYTSITWGGGVSSLSADLRSAAQAYFANNQQKTFITAGAQKVITGVTAPLSDILGFLAQFQPTYINGVNSHLSGYPSIFSRAAQISFGNQSALVKSLIRTGDGAIDVAAAGDVDLTNGAITYRNDKVVLTTAAKGAQVGGSAIYTAGHRIAASAIQANIVGTGALVSVTPASPYLSIAPELVNFIPSPKNLDDRAGVLAVGGGAVSIDAGGNILGRRDVWSETYLDSGGVYGTGQLTTFVSSAIGDASQRWRPGTVGQDTEIAIAPRYFTSGIGALGGGDVTIRSGLDVRDLTVALDTSVTTAATSAGATKLTVGSGSLKATIGASLAAGQIDIASGSGTISVGASVSGYGTEPQATKKDTTQYLRLRVADATIALEAQGAIALAGISSLGAGRPGNDIDKYASAGFFSPSAGVSMVATGSVGYVDNRLDQTVPFQIGEGNGGNFGGSVLPPSLTLASLTAELTAPSQPLLLYPSRLGNLRLFSAGDISSLVIAMSDSDPSLLPGAFSASQTSLVTTPGLGSGNVTARVGLGFGIPGADPTTSDHLLRLYHNERSTHLGDTTPIEIFAGNDIVTSLISVPKQARISAGHDIVDLFFTGQNVAVGDTTLISAGHDIFGSTVSSAAYNLPYIASSNFTLGGPGAFVLQAGRNIGPFINSATVSGVSYAGGVRTVGNDLNPWIAAQGADLSLLFGVAPGINYAGLRDTYLKPANLANLDGDLFVQVADSLGNLHPDRSKPVYAPILATWLRSNAPVAFAQVFGTSTTYPDTSAGNAALATMAYAKVAELYNALTGLDTLLQNKFLLNDLYFNEIKQPAQPNGPSYLQYVRGYRAIQTLFPASLGYTDNLAAYTTDPATVNADHPLGVPTRKVVNGQPVPAAQVKTGNVDLRLAMLQTTRGGDITIVGPGGTFIAGSVVRTSEQAARRVTRFGVDPTASLTYGQLTNANVNRIGAIPIGYEGVLTLRGGSISAFTDGDFRVNQSRVFSQAGGDITLWSSNGDLNAGQGPKSASNFPPITVRFNLDGVSEVDSAGSVSGAGIGAFKQSPNDPASTVILIAPVGLVDAGDAGVRASGDIFVAAARVANADSFSAGGSVAGVPSLAASPVSVAPGAANSATAATVNNGSNGNADRRSQISVDVLGYAGSANLCEDPDANDPNCKRH